MYCAQCGHELPTGASACPSCHAPAAGAHPVADSFDQVVADAKRAAKDLASATGQLAERIAAKADRAAKDPTGSARRGARKVANELDKARKEIEKILNDL